MSELSSEVRLPATVATKRSSIGSSEVVAAATATTTATTTATPAAIATVAMTTAATVADHLGETGVNLLLGLSENGDQVTSLLGVCKMDMLVLKRRFIREETTYCQW